MPVGLYGRCMVFRFRPSSRSIPPPTTCTVSTVGTEESLLKKLPPKNAPPKKWVNAIRRPALPAQRTRREPYAPFPPWAFQPTRRYPSRIPRQSTPAEVLDRGIHRRLERA